MEKTKSGGVIMTNEARENKQPHQYHPDGKQENSINDATASQGKQMGITIDMDPNNPYQFRNAFNYTPSKDPEMEKFKEFTSETDE
jgi:hypothetical protein